MTYTPSELFTARMVQVLGNWIDASNIMAVSAIEECPQESEYFFMVSFKHGGAIDIESDSAVEIDDAHDAVMEAWDTAIQREAMQKQFERGLENEQNDKCDKGMNDYFDKINKAKELHNYERPHGVTLSVNMPDGTTTSAIVEAIDEAKGRILDRISDAGGGE